MSGGIFLDKPYVFLLFLAICWFVALGLAHGLDKPYVFLLFLAICWFVALGLAHGLDILSLKMSSSWSVSTSTSFLVEGGSWYEIVVGVHPKFYASNIGYILNLSTSSVSPQYHVVHDVFFLLFLLPWPSKAGLISVEWGKFFTRWDMKMFWTPLQTRRIPLPSPCHPKSRSHVGSRGSRVAAAWGFAAVRDI